MQPDESAFSDPSYKMTANINDKNIPLFVIHQLSDKEHQIYPLQDNASGPHKLDDGTYNHKLEFDGDENIYLELRTKNEEDMEGLVEYLFGPDLEPLAEAADSAKSYAYSVNGNEMACNVGVRAAVYLYKNDPILFPVKHNNEWGAALYCDSISDGKCYTAPENVLSGEVTWDGKANNIYDDLDNDKLSKFESISNVAGCNYPDFDELQKQANNGAIIIGVRKNASGYFGMTMPPVSVK